MTGPFDRAYRGGFWCSDVDALYCGVVKVVGSTGEEKDKHLEEDQRQSSSTKTYISF